jgi:hypothetical protein
MRKLLIISAAAAALSLTGCGPKNEAEPAPSTETVADENVPAMANDSAGGGNEAMSNATAEPANNAAATPEKAPAGAAGSSAGDKI